ncbi:MAG: hypothetical protein ABEJ24_03470 [Candidatus Magasanikbacteria bacterium]
MQEKIRKLKNIAKLKMKSSSDPVHDLDHVRRVVDYTKEILSEYDCFNKKQKQAVILAAWWHDVGRTINGSSSFLVVSFFFDDLLSALNLWFFTLKNGLFGNVVGISTRIIFCSNLGENSIISKILLTEDSRELMSILQDADQLDLLSTDRMHKLYRLSEKSVLVQYGYKSLVWWYLHKEKLKFHTKKARQISKKLLNKLLEWVETEVENLHSALFGESFTCRSTYKLRRICRQAST